MDGAVAREVPAPRPFSPQRRSVVTTSYPCPIPPGRHHACVSGPLAYHTALTVASQILHPTHMKPEGAGVFVTRDAGQGFVLHLRPVTDSAAGAIIWRRRTQCYAHSPSMTLKVLCRFDHAATDGGGHQYALHDAADEPQSAARTEQCRTAEAAVTADRYSLGAVHANPCVHVPRAERLQRSKGIAELLCATPVFCEVSAGDACRSGSQIGAGASAKSSTASAPV